MKDAEGFKFLTVKGALIYLHDLGVRKIPFEKAVQQVKYKAQQKLAYISLPDEKKVAERNYKTIVALLNSIID